MKQCHGKNCYRSTLSAYAAASACLRKIISKPGRKSLEEYNAEDKISLRAYKCRECRMWHLTKRVLKEERK